MPTVMSVTGPVDADELGFTLIHEHIFLDLRNDVWLADRMLNDPELAYEELMRYKDAGGVTLVDQTSGGLRGNKNRILPIKHPLAIRDMAERTDLQIILGCGWYREPYYEEYLHRAKTDEIAEEIVQECEVGIEDTVGCGLGSNPVTTSTASRAKSPCQLDPDVYTNLSHSVPGLPMLTVALFQPSPWSPPFDQMVV